MASPTARALKRKPLAVVMLASPTNKPGKEIEYDFEWFETPEGMDDYFKDASKWNDEDFKENGDLCHLTIEVTDTTELKIGKTHCSPTTDKMKKWRDRVKKNPELMLVPVETPNSDEGQVKARKKPNGGVAKTGDTPKVRAKKVVPPKKAAAKKVAGATPEVKAKNLRDRLAAKKRAADAEASVKPPRPTKKAPAKTG